MGEKNFKDILDEGGVVDYHRLFKKIEYDDSVENKDGSDFYEDSWHEKYSTIHKWLKKIRPEGEKA